MIYDLPLRRRCMLIQYSAQKVTVLVRLFKDEYSETLDSSAINDGRSMLAMFIAILHVVEG